MPAAWELPHQIRRPVGVCERQSIHDYDHDPPKNKKNKQFCMFRAFSGKKMYGLTLSKSIADTIDVTPRKYATLTRNTRDRFHHSNKRSNNNSSLLPFYNSDFLAHGNTSTVSSTLQHTPIKYSNLRSKKQRFPNPSFVLLVG